MNIADWFNRSFGYQTEPPLLEVKTPRPRLAVVNTAPSREEWAAWRDDPITLFVFAAMRAAAAMQREAWLEASWHGAKADQALLTELRTRADAYEALEIADYEAWCEWAGVEPGPVEPHAA